MVHKYWKKEEEEFIINNHKLTAKENLSKGGKWDGK